MADSDLSTATEEILSRERHALDQWSKGNPLGYLDVHADDVTYFDDIAASDLVVGKPAVKDYMEGLVGNIPPHSYEIADPNVQLYGDTGVLSLHYKGQLEDGTPLPVWKATSVYRKNGGVWEIVHAHWSLVKAGPDSDR